MSATDPKVQNAHALIHLIRKLNPEVLNALIVREAGEPLAQFFLNYSANLIAKDPSRILENCSSLMLMGYLIRAAEDGTRVPELQPTQPGAAA